MGRRNECPNPALGTDMTGWGGSAPNGYTTLRVTGVTGLSRSTAFKLALSSSGGFATILAARYAPGGSIAGQLFTVYGEYRPTATMSVQAGAVFADSSGGVTLAYPSAGTATGNNNYSFRWAATAPANSIGVYVGFTTSNAPASSSVFMTCARIERISDSGMGYADGSTTGWAWDGAAGSSPSGAIPAAGAPAHLSTFTQAVARAANR